VHTERATTNQLELPRFRVVRGFEGIVRVDTLKAQNAMRHAMVMREGRRASDEERNRLISSSHAT
jgi:hypothetical protein